MSQTGVVVVCLGVFIGSVWVVEGCSRPASDDHAIAQQQQISQPDSQARLRAPGANESLGAVIRRLGQLPGTFVKSSSGHWEWTGDRSVLSAIANYGDSAVVRLVDCLDDTQPAAATVDGQHVLGGFMCYSALDYAAYHEWDPEEYRHAKHERWPGVLDPAAGADDLRAAKAAWKDVVLHKRYSLS